MQNQDKAQAGPDVEPSKMNDIKRLRADLEARVTQIQSQVDEQSLLLRDIDKALAKLKERLRDIQQLQQAQAKAQPQTQPQQSQQSLPSAAEGSMADPGNQPEEELRDRPSSSSSSSSSSSTRSSSAVTPVQAENTGEHDGLQISSSIACNLL